MKQNSTNKILLKIYLVDDGSTDGTTISVKNRFSDIKIIKGNGKLFWCGGMRLAFSDALKEKYDYYLWLNDDSMLFPHALQTMLKTSFYCNKKTGKNCIIVGSMQDAKTGLLSYGGSKKVSWWRPLSYILIEPSDRPMCCDVFNGNCVLIPYDIAQVLGNLDKNFTHGLGDYEYGIRATKNGFTSMLAPGYIGTCSRNTLKNTCKDNTLSIKERIDQLSNPSILPPTNEYMKFIRIHGGIFWPLYWLRTLIRQIFPWLWVILR